MELIMVTIVAKCTVKPGMGEDYKKAAQPLIQASQSEPGCIAYDLYQDIKNPDIFTFIEHWQDDAAVAFHNNTEHFKTIVPQLGQFREGPSEVNLYKKL